MGNWKQIALPGFDEFLEAYGLRDLTVSRPTEAAALRNLEWEARLHGKDLSLSILERQVWTLEKQFLALYHDRTWRVRNGVEGAGDKYAWIAQRVPGLARLQVRGLLEEISYVLRAIAYEDMVEGEGLELAA